MNPISQTPRFGATLNVHSYHLENHTAESAADLAELSSNTRRLKDDFVKVDEGKPDQLTINVVQNGDNIRADVVSRTNGGFNYSRDEDQTIKGFMEELLNRTKALAATLISPEEKLAKEKTELRKFITGVHRAVRDGDFDLVEGSAKTKPAADTFLFHGGLYTQTAQITIEDKTYQVTRRVSKGRREDITLTDITSGDSGYSASMDQYKDPTGDTAKDVVQRFTSGSGVTRKDWHQEYQQADHSTQVMLQNMMDKLDEMFLALASKGVLLPFKN